ncbi:pilin [Actinoplanes couchii]|uniref:Integral membrane protein n=1 Tax=Actinoplanes couchii TaxID=403638 RepID=A0ABQ3XRL7_9ACTN|nr:pilin [Actinoplanes couchii]MDR6318911.1 hypothetical protein [Actinoplanes couchii]GID61150.1 hypothetical protein Aco03nite_095540 [Actinoplanes couchii]
MHIYAVVSFTSDLIAAAPPEVWAVKSIPQVVDGLRNWIIGILVGVATLFMVLAGLQYTSAGGDPGRLEQAKSNFRSALIGYALAVMAPVLLQVLRGILGA